MITDSTKYQDRPVAVAHDISPRDERHSFFMSQRDIEDSHNRVFVREMPHVWVQISRT